MSKYNIDLSIIILNYNGYKDTIDCYNSIIEKTKNINYEIIIIDNKSTDDSVMMLNNLKNIIFIEADYNCGFSRGNNLGIKEAKGDYIILLNNDTELINDALSIMVDFMKNHPDAGAIGPQLYYPNGSLQKSYGPFHSLKNRCGWEYGFEIKEIFRLLKNKKIIEKKETENKESGHKESENILPIFGRPRGCAFMVKHSYIKQIGMLDERFFIYCEETDWALRFYKYGLTNYVLRNAKIMHKWAGTTQSNGSLFDMIHTSSYYKFYKKHNGSLGVFKLHIAYIKGAVLNIFLLLLSCVFKTENTKKYYFKQFINKIKKGFLFYEPLPNGIRKKWRKK